MSDDPVMVVVFEDTGRTLEVRRACNRCYGGAESVSEIGALEVVSRYGTAHAVGGEAYMTRCGRDARGPQWWWPS